jgi:hypothetical protein
MSETKSIPLTAPSLMRRSFAAMRHPGFRAQFITFVPAMMADNRPRDINPSSRGNRRPVVFWLPTAILPHRGRLLLITRRTA